MGGQHPGMGKFVVVLEQESQRIRLDIQQKMDSFQTRIRNFPQ
ncbi:hypothetical protein PPTG_24623 [Phytophthora nicotianae INRA-310]|uniref:Uncharacterized protein n=1 Tax=Phytophthora nicotianae (strain INRA-310) TaxID=761204 RepID=W2PEL1_PHYN3|nr:hypothetical protein PPTG_24623 [Phytophthora nicotianae INRA-310]ETM98434.1 hypothetical protein PPTG_24623 [Phytophthora nicotianae INRA-310]